MDEEFHDPLTLWRVETSDGDNQPTSLRNMLRGSEGAFLVAGGPSLKAMDYSRIAERGVWSLGINNVSGMAPVRAHVSSDPPAKFHHGIWLDPSILKFSPRQKMGTKEKSRIRIKQGDGTFVSERPIRDCPNVFAFDRRSWLACDDTFFTDPQAAWGNHDSGVAATGEPKTVCTLLLGIRLLYYLGVRRIFLLGVDFKMEPGSCIGMITERGEENVPTFDGGYAFGQGRTVDNCLSNQEHFVVVNDWLVRLRPTFEKFGLKVFNCNPYSGLRAFDHVPFTTALEICRGRVPVEPFDLAGWYEK